MKFEGIEAFNESGSKLKGSVRKKSSEKNKILKAYFPDGKVKVKWQAAVEGKIH